MKDVILIDAGTGNLRSVQKALEAVGATVERTNEPQRVRAGRRVVLPGVGAFGDFMSGLRAQGLEESIREVANRNSPLLGICVGMQALFDVGEEMGKHPGLGLLAGRVVRFEESFSIKVPHTGWNQLRLQRESALMKGIQGGAHVYFNHSFYCLPEEAADTVATTDYGLPYSCIVQRGNLYGVQFHPEKSQSVGLQILRNFLEAT